MIPESCRLCQGGCCRVGWVIQVFPEDIIYNDETYVDQQEWPLDDGPFKCIKSNGDGTTCIALGKNHECTIHSKRPKTCRDLEMDGDRCKEIRKLYGRA